MNKIEDVIRYENENTSIDFKAIEYTKDKYVDLLKDVMSMANADTLSDKYIIIGVKLHSDGTRNILGISQLIDSATIQQLVYYHIEPEITIDYTPFEIDNKVLGILKISDCRNQPYMIKKDYSSGNKHLVVGDGYIRKGSSQMHLTRSDLDRIYQTKHDNIYFDDKITISSKEKSYQNMIILRKAGILKFPSDLKKNEIERVLKEKKKEADMYSHLGSQFIPEQFNMRRTMALSMGYGLSYEDCTIDELEKKLSNIEKTYAIEDLYYLFEKKSNKINLSIENCGSKYIEDATLCMIFPKIEGVIIANEIPVDPNGNEYTLNPNLHYPNVIDQGLHICIMSTIGNIKHGLSSDAFVEDLRIVVTDKVNITEFEVECQLYGRNIKNYIPLTVKVKIQPED
ncbi:MAG: putative DNA binding domain-containing protein [Tannerellaceae bacterium]|jgi:hypothetical protein|nr:putative DNA binding domain-containing protein [Tannerellaceae bacterium]